MKTSTVIFSVIVAVAGILTLTVATAVVGFAALVMLGEAQYGKRMDYKTMEVYYTTQVTETEAKQFIQHLETHLDDTTKRITFQLDRQGDDFIVRMCAQEYVYTTNQMDEFIQAMRDEIHADCYPNENVIFEACDDKMRTKKTWRAKPLPAME